jgi:hypothetical protein
LKETFCLNEQSADKWLGDAGNTGIKKKAEERNRLEE